MLDHQGDVDAWEALIDKLDAIADRLEDIDASLTAISEAQGKNEKS